MYLAPAGPRKRERNVAALSLLVVVANRRLSELRAVVTPTTATVAHAQESGMAVWVMRHHLNPMSDKDVDAQR